MGLFNKAGKIFGKVVAVVPVAGPIVAKGLREVGRIGDQAVGRVAHDVGHLVENTIKESGKGVSKFVGEVTGSRRKANQEADEQNQKRRSQVTVFLNSRGDEDVQRLGQELFDMLDAYGREHDEALQQGFDAATVMAMYQQWRMAVIELGAPRSA